MPDQIGPERATAEAWALAICQAADGALRRGLTRDEACFELELLVVDAPEAGVPEADAADWVRRWLDDHYPQRVGS
jgi:hypothetical protein